MLKKIIALSSIPEFELNFQESDKETEELIREELKERYNELKNKHPYFIENLNKEIENILTSIQDIYTKATKQKEQHAALPQLELELCGIVKKKNMLMDTIKDLVCDINKHEAMKVKSQDIVVLSKKNKAIQNLLDSINKYSSSILSKEIEASELHSYIRLVLLSTHIDVSFSNEDNDFNRFTSELGSEWTSLPNEIRVNIQIDIHDFETTFYGKYLNQRSREVRGQHNGNEKCILSYDIEQSLKKLYALFNDLSDGIFNALSETYLASESLENEILKANLLKGLIESCQNSVKEINGSLDSHPISKSHSPLDQCANYTNNFLGPIAIKYTDWIKSNVSNKFIQCIAPSIELLEKEKAKLSSEQNLNKEKNQIIDKVIHEKVHLKTELNKEIYILEGQNLILEEKLRVLKQSPDIEEPATVALGKTEEYLVKLENRLSCLAKAEQIEPNQDLRSFKSWKDVVPNNDYVVIIGEAKAIICFSSLALKAILRQDSLTQNNLLNGITKEVKKSRNSGKWECQNASPYRLLGEETSVDNKSVIIFNTLKKK